MPKTDRYFGCPNMPKGLYPVRFLLQFHKSLHWEHYFQLLWQQCGSRALYHLLHIGTGPRPTSVKLLDSGQIPVSRIPIITSLSIVKFRRTFTGKPVKSHDSVVRSWRVLLGNTDTTSSCPEYIYVYIYNMKEEIFTIFFQKFEACVLEFYVLYRSTSDTLVQ